MESQLIPLMACRGAIPLHWTCSAKELHMTTSGPQEAGITFYEGPQDETSRLPFHVYADAGENSHID
jgi:hypothetical protein